MPYRIDLESPSEDAFDTLVDLGALDVEATAGGLAALMPDAVAASDVANALGIAALRVSDAVGRDDDSVWTLSPRPVRTRRLLIVPATGSALADAIRIVDGPAFGTGLHATTALCLEAIEDLLDVDMPDRMLDVGTGSGVLALAALRLGVPFVLGLDVDPQALAAAAANARLNGLDRRLSLVHGGPDAAGTSWSLIVANIRAAELMAMAATLVWRVRHGGRMVLSGIPTAVAPDVEHAYRHLGMTQVGLYEHRGWTALVLRPSW